MDLTVFHCYLDDHYGVDALSVLLTRFPASWDLGRRMRLEGNKTLEYYIYLVFSF